ncbi:MmgE/PrpD family protein [Variovorax sp. PBL-H6]|nr:MmgE/PrpD family protein [Variovorax sp. PBL-H6]VTU33438.1 MmgE/PrpD family protein [Variovorax sp. PBL-H6]
MGRYVASMQAQDLPPVQLDRLAACMLYNFSIASAGYDPSDVIQSAMLAVHNAPGCCSLLAGGAPRSAVDAAGINAEMIAAGGQTDTHIDMGGHLGCVVIPAVLALAEQRNASPRDIVAALSAGYELPPRIGRGAVAETTARGFRGTSLFGVFGAAAGAARVIGLDPQRTAHALSLAANLAGGITQCYTDGSPEGPLQVAHASRAGVHAALLAEQGVTASHHVFEGGNGFFKAFSGAVHDVPLDGWTLPEVTFKPFPGCAINQLPVFVLLDIMRAESLETADIETVDLRLAPSHASYPGIDRHGPFDTRMSAVMSAPFMMQVAMDTGTLHRADFSQRFGAHDSVHGRSSRIRVHADAALAPFESRLEMTLVDGRRLKRAAPPVSALALDWAQTLALCAGLSRGWPVADGTAAFERLRVAVEALMYKPAAGSLANLMEASRASARA